ncbi:MAG TPA: hypothetical protein ENH08_05795 [Chromatiales bacterium]|nr:hypothetical protein [Chromatiales bacterium]
MPTYIVRLFHRDDGQVLGLVESVERRVSTPFHSFPELCSVLEGAARPENRDADPETAQDIPDDGG